MIITLLSRWPRRFEYRGKIKARRLWFVQDVVLLLIIMEFGWVTIPFGVWHVNCVLILEQTLDRIQLVFSQC